MHTGPAYPLGISREDVERLIHNGEYMLYIRVRRSQRKRWWLANTKKPRAKLPAHLRRVLREFVAEVPSG